MKGGKEDGKPMDPMFPRLHISDADKGGPRAPPRNKMALCDQYNVAKIGPGSLPFLPILPSQSSSSNVGGVKGKYNTVVAKSEPWMPQTEGYGTPPDNSVMKAKCNNLVQPNDRSSYSDCYKRLPRDEHDFKSPPYFLQSGRSFNYGKIQLHPCTERASSFSPASAGELRNVCLKLPKVTSSEDRKLSRDKESCSEKPCGVSLLGAKNFSDTFLAGDKSSDFGIREFRSNQIKKLGSGDEQPILNQECKVLPKCRAFTDVKSGVPETVTRKRCALAMDDSSSLSPRLGSSNGPNKANLIRECAKDAYCEILPIIGNTEKNHDSNASTEASARGFDLTADDVLSVIGHRLFWKARKTIIHQQRLFSLQIFELHRLIKVQKLIKPSILFPPINKLIFMNPTDSLPAAAKTKHDTDKDCGAEAVINEILPIPTEKGHVSQQTTTRPLLPMLPSIPIDTKVVPLPVPVSVPTDAKLAPWCLNPPPGSQWLVPVRSPSEGLVYKSYPGPCFPSTGFVPPVYGNCGPVTLSTVGGTAYGVPLGQNYFQSYGMPPINASGLSLEGEQINSSSSGNANAGVPFETSCKDLIVDEKNDQQGSEPSSPEERMEGKTLPLFPTTPSCKVLNDDQSKVDDDQTKVQVIKVVPCSRKSAAESAARIFQSIQEERKRP